MGRGSFTASTICAIINFERKLAKTEHAAVLTGFQEINISALAFSTVIIKFPTNKIHIGFVNKPVT